MNFQILKNVKFVLVFYVSCKKYHSLKKKNEVLLNKQTFQYDAFNHTKYHSEKDQNVNGLYVDYKEEKDSQNQENEYIDLEDGEKIIKNAKVGNYEVNNEERNMDSNEENDENQLVLMKFKTMKIIKILQIFTNQWN